MATSGETAFDPAAFAPSAELANSRIDWQEDYLCTLADGLTELARARIDGQEDYLADIYKPITRRGVQRVRRDGEKLSRVLAPAIADVRARLDGASSDLKQLARGADHLEERQMREAEIDRALNGEADAGAIPPAGGTVPVGEFDAPPTQEAPPGAAPRGTPAGRDIGGATPGDCGVVVREARFPGVDEPLSYLYFRTTGEPVPPHCQSFDDRTDPTLRGRLLGEGFVFVGSGYAISTEGRVIVDWYFKPSVEGCCPEKPADDKIPDTEIPPGEKLPDDDIPPDEKKEKKDDGDIKREVVVALPDLCGRLDYASGEMCRTVDQLVGEFRKLGQWMIDAVADTVDDAAEAINGLGQLVNAPIIGPIADWAWEQSKDAREMIRNIAAFVTDLRDAGEAKGEKAMIALWFARALIQTVERSVIGLNFGVQLTIEIKAMLTQASRIVSYLIEYVCPTTLPERTEIDQMYRANVIPEDVAECLTKLHGYQWPATKRAIFASRQQPTSDQLVRLRMRNLISEDDLSKYLRGQNWLDPKDIETFRRQFDFLPPPSDLIRFAVKDVFDPNKEGRDEMLEELEEQKELLALLEQQGIKDIQGSDGKGGLREWKIPYYYWLSSYDEISPTQSYTMLQRLRPNRIERYAQRVKPTDEQLRTGKVAGAVVLDNTDPQSWLIAPEEMTIRHVQKLLKEVDYNPIWRHRLAAISYRPIGRIDARKMYTLGVFGKPIYLEGIREASPGKWEVHGEAETELYEQFQDQGYAPVDALAQTVYTIQEESKRLRNAKQRGVKTSVCQLLTAGGITPADAVQRLRRAGFSLSESEGAVDECEARLVVSRLKAHTAAVRKLFMRGALTLAQVRETLAQAGVERAHADHLVSLWSLQRAGQGPEVKAREMCDWAGTGLLSYDEMTIRLRNLGYSEIDTARIVRQCQFGHAGRTAKEQRAAAIAAERLRERQEAERRRLEREAERRAGVPQKGTFAAEVAKDIKGWWGAKVIDERIVRQMLARKMWAPEDVERWIAANKPKEG